MISSFYGFLESVGFRQPLHPIPVRFTVAMVVGALIFALIARRSQRQAFYVTARHVLNFGIIAYAFTALTGLADWVHFYGAAWNYLIRMKMILSLVLLLLLVTAFQLNVKNKGESTIQIVVYALSAIVVAFIVYYGGELAY